MKVQRLYKGFCNNDPNKEFEIYGIMAACDCPRFHFDVATNKKLPDKHLASFYCEANLELGRLFLLGLRVIGLSPSNTEINFLTHQDSDMDQAHLFTIHPIFDQPCAANLKLNHRVDLLLSPCGCPMFAITRLQEAKLGLVVHTARTEFALFALVTYLIQTNTHLSTPIKFSEELLTC